MIVVKPREPKSVGAPVMCTRVAHRYCTVAVVLVLPRQPVGYLVPYWVLSYGETVQNLWCLLPPSLLSTDYPGPQSQYGTRGLALIGLMRRDLFCFLPCTKQRAGCRYCMSLPAQCFCWGVRELQHVSFSTGPIRDTWA